MNLRTRPPPWRAWPTSSARPSCSSSASGTVSLKAYASFHTGSFVQNVCLAAFDRGLGACIVATVIRYPDLLRRLLPGAEDKRFVVPVTLGSPVAGSPANTVERSRADLDELVTWVS